MASWDDFPVVGEAKNTRDPWGDFPVVEETAEKEEPFFDISDTLSAAGQAVKGIPTTTPHAFRQLYSGLENPWTRSEGYKESQKSVDAYQQELEAANLEAEKSGDISTMSRGMRQAGQSLGFSAGAMGAGLVASTPSAAAGRSLGALAGPEGAVAGEIIGRGAGALASGYGAAYRMAGAQFLDDARKEIDAKFLKVTGELPNEQQQEEAYQELLPLAQAFGHAEAGPEAIGNLAMAGAGKYVFGLGRKTIEKLAASALGKTGAVAGALGTELVGETITGVEQNRIDSQKKDLLEGRDPSELAPRTADEYVESFKEVAPATLATMGLMGVAPAAVKAADLLKTKPPAPTDDFTQRAAMEGATSTEPIPVEVEGVTIATINPESGWTPEDVLDFANSPEDMATLARNKIITLARNKIITLPEVVAPIEGVDPAITDEMNERVAASAALAPQTVEALKAAQTVDTEADIPETQIAPTVGETAAPEVDISADTDSLGVTPPPAPALEAPEGAARNAEMLRQAAARAAGTEQGPRIGFLQSPSTAVTAETETPDSTANAVGGSQGVQTESTGGSYPAVTEDIVSTSDTPSTAETPPVTPQGEAPTTATEGQPMPGGSSEPEWSPTPGQSATANINGQKVVGTVSGNLLDGRKLFRYNWNGKTQETAVRPERLTRPVASLTEPPSYQYTQEQNTRKAGKHFPTAPGVHANHDFRKSFASMAEDTSLSRIYRQIAKVMSKMDAFANIDLHIVADGDIGYAGEYSHSNGKSSIAVNLRQVARGKVDALGTILHEALHHITLAKVRNPQGAFETEVVAKLDTIRKRVKEYAKQQGLGKRLGYELNTLEEFISALTSPDFQNFLASIPDSFSTGVSVGKFRSALSEVFRLIAELIKGEPVARGSTMEQYFTTVLALFETPHRTLDIGKLEKLSAVQSEAEEPLVSFLTDKTGSPTGQWDGVLTSAEQKKLFGFLLVGKAQVRINGESKTLKAKRSVGFGQDSDIQTIEFEDIPKYGKRGRDIFGRQTKSTVSPEPGDKDSRLDNQGLVRSLPAEGVLAENDGRRTESGMGDAPEPESSQKATPFSVAGGYHTPADMLAEAAQKAKGEAVGTKPQGLASMFKPQAKRPPTGERKLLDMPVRNTLANAYREAVRGSGTQFAPLSSVYAQARLLQPGLTPEAFLAQVQEGYDNGTLLLEGAGSQQEAAQSSLSLPGTPVGTAVRMMPAPETPKSLVDEETDAAYMDAVEAGDMETAQRMVDEAAKSAGYEKRWNFSENIGIDPNRGAFYTTSNKSAADSWGEGREGKTRPVFISSKAPAIEGKNILSSSFMTPELAGKLKAAGFDSASGGRDWKRGDEIAVFSPNQIKSADPVTRDEAGNVIPLSQRFNPESPSTLYSLAEEGEPPTIDIGGEAEPADGKGKQLYQKDKTAIGDTYVSPADITLQEKKTQQETLDAARKIIGEEIAKNPNNTLAGRRAALDRFSLDTSIPPEVRAVGTGVIAQQADRMANLSEGDSQLLLDRMAEEAASLSDAMSSDLEGWRNLKADANLRIDKMAEEAGRTLNIFNVFRRLTPEGFLRRRMRQYNDAVREKMGQNFDVPAAKVESEIAMLRRMARESTSPERRKAILDAIKAYKQHDIDAKKLIEALFPQAGFRARMNKGGESLVRDFFQMMAGARDQKGPLAEFDETIQGALSSMLRKVMEAKGLVAKNESVQMKDIDKLVRAISADELRFDKIAAADEAMQKELDAIEDPERRAVLQQAWEEATAKMYTNIASDATVRRALNAEMKSANVDWTKMFDSNQKPDAIKAKTVDAVMAKIEALLTDSADPTVRANLGMLRSEVEAAFDFIAANKRTEWLAQREAIEARRRVAEHRAAFMEALRNQGVAEQAINRISEKLAGPQRGKPDQNPVSALVGEHMKAEVPSFVDKMVALDVDRTTAESLDKAATKLRTEVAAAEKLKAADRAVAQLMKSLKPKPRAPREKIERALKTLFTADTVGALDDQAFFDAFGEAFNMPPLSDEQQTRIKKLIREVNALPKGPARLDKQQDLDEELALWKGIAARDVLLSAWYANILSGVSTQGMGLLGNALNFVPRSLFNMINNPRSAGAYFKGAFGEGLSTGLKEAKAAMAGRGLYKVSKYGDKSLVSALELLRKKGPSTLPEWVAYIASAGTRLRYVFRIMQAIDALAWNTAREGHAYLAAHRALLEQEKASGTKRTPEEFSRAFIDSLGGDTAQIEEDLRAARQALIDAGQPPSMLTVDRMAREARNLRREAGGVKAGNRFADRIVLQQDPEGSGKFISNLIDVFQKKDILGLPIGQLLIPFNRIVSNLFEQSLDYTPVGLVRAFLGGHLSDVKPGSFWNGKVEFKDKSQLFDQMERRERAMAAVTGMAAAAIIYALASAHEDEPDEDTPFMVYGWGPESKNKRAQMPKGWVPYSIKIGDNYIKFSEMPFGMMFAAAGSAMDAMRYKNMDKKTSTQRLAYVLKTAAKGFLNQGVMSSLDTAMETLMFDASEKKMADIPVNALKGLVPAQGMLRDISTIMDPNKVSSESLTSALLRDIPFAKSWGTKPDLNVFGEPIKLDGYPITRRIITHREPHAVADYLGRNELHIPGMEQTIEIGKYLPDKAKDRIQARAVELGAMENGLFTPEQNYAFKKRAGELTKAAVQEIMKKAPKIATDKQRENVQSDINKSVEKARKRAMLEAVPVK